VDLDLSRAIFEEPSVVIQLQLTYGRARITVPADAVVDLDGLTTVWKQPKYRAPQGAGTGGPTIRIFGRSTPVVGPVIGPGRHRRRHNSSTPE
jgi:hypothetical protein